MTVPGIVQETLGEEGVAAQVSLGGEDELFVTPSRTLIYRGEGLLSDETVEEYPHEAERVEVAQGRRKAKIVLHHGIEGERTFSLPGNRLEDALHPVLAGVLNAAGVTEPGETVKRTFLFSEMTVIVTSHRLVKHIGEAVWDVDYEEYPFADATDLKFEEGSVATQIVLEVGGRRERIKAPNEQSPEVRAELEEALFEFHGVSGVEELRSQTATESDDDGSADGPTDDVSFESGLSPLDAVGGDDTDDATGTVDVIETGTAADDAPAGDDPIATMEGAATADAGGAAASTGTPDATEPADADPASIDDASLGVDEGVSNEELADRLDELTEAVKRQNDLLATHAETIERLIEELKRMD